MHPRKEVPEAPPVLDAVAEAAADLDVLVADGALDELLPHAASSRLVAAAAAAVINAVCLTVSSTGPGCRSPGVAGLPPGPDCPKGKTCSCLLGRASSALRPRRCRIAIRKCSLS
jgi:hypothetical protein